MKDFRIVDSLKLLIKTLPFVGLRTAVYFGCTIIWIAAVVGGVYLGQTLIPNPFIGGWVGLAVGASVAGAITYFMREYFLYLAKAGHIAVLVELMDGRGLPAGQGQLSYAKDRVAESFSQASVFFAVDQVIKSVLRVVNGLLVGFGSFLPGMDGVASFAGRVIKMSLTYADEVILGLTFRTRSRDPWRTSRDGIVLYAQSYKAILKSAMFLAVIKYIITFVVFLLCTGPAYGLVAVLPGSSQFYGLITAIILAFSFKKAIVDPFCMIALMQVYFKAIQGQEPNPEWQAKLESASDKFRGMTENCAYA